jgi:hypothetical protein
MISLLVRTLCALQQRPNRARSRFGRAGEDLQFSISTTGMQSRGSIAQEDKSPSIPDDECQRVFKTIALHEGFSEKHPDGWTREDCYKHMGLGKTTFYRFLKIHKEGTLTQEGILNTGGRPPLLSEEATQELYHEVEQKSLDLRAVKAGPIFLDMVRAKIRSEAPNQLVNSEHFTPSPTYIAKLAKLFVVINKASIKNKSRLKAFEDVCNSLSLCAAVYSYDLRGMSLYMWTSFDDVLVYLNNFEKPRVLTTKKAQQILAAQKISVSTGDDEAQRR